MDPAKKQEPSKKCVFFFFVFFFLYNGESNFKVYLIPEPCKKNSGNTV